MRSPFPIDAHNADNYLAFLSYKPSAAKSFHPLRRLHAAGGGSQRFSSLLVRFLKYELSRTLLCKEEVWTRVRLELRTQRALVGTPFLMSYLLLTLLLLFSAADKVLAASARPVGGSPSFIYSIGGCVTALGGACCLKTAHGTPSDSERGSLLAQQCRAAPRPAAQLGVRSVSFVSWRLSAPPGVLFQGRGQLLGPTCLQMSEKRYKEQLMGKKFTSVGRSSIARHYRIQGRGGGKPRVRKATGLPTNPIILPARRCMLLGKMDNRKARSISHSGKRMHRVQRVNLAWKRLWWPEGGHYVWLRLSMKGLKTIKKYGLQRAADKFKLNLKDKRLYGGVSHRGKYRQSSLQEAALRAAGALQAGGPSFGNAPAVGLPAVMPPLAAGPAGAAIHTPASSAAQASAALASTSAAAPVASVVTGTSSPT